MLLFKHFVRQHSTRKLLSATVASATLSTKFSYNFLTHRKLFCNKILLGCAAQQNMSETVVTYLDTPDKSENDKKIYKTLLLGNGLHALIISDPSPVPHDGFTSSSESSMEEEGPSSTSESSSDNASSSSSSSTTAASSDSDSEEGDEKLAACAIMIDYGSFAEPREYQGLAHFLEHMIFMGSEKYPEENAFDAHIKKCGGFSNAHTECENTLFYFEVAEAHLNSTLDYFTELMKKPLIKQDAMQRERCSIESEFQQIKQDDETRRDQLLASLATEGFPHGTFAWGNMKSLKENVNDADLHKLLHEIRKDHYGANRIYVCLQARLPIDELESLVVRHFGGIPTNTIKAPDLTRFNYRDAFRPEFYEEVFFVKPVENECKLELTWVLPPVHQYYRSKPDHFLSNLMGYEGMGSLCAYLRRRLWGLQLIAGIDENGFDLNTMYSLFNICIYLTDDGFKHIDEVLAAIFAYIKLFTDISPLRQVYEEQQSIEATGFRFQAQRPAFDNVQELVINTKYYPPKDILTGSELYYEYNEEQLKHLIDHLNQFKFNIMITSKQKYEGISYDKQEKWFGTEYTSIPMPEKWKRLWEESTPIEELYMPKPNPFVTRDFTIYWQQHGKPDVPSAPKKLLKTDTCELWFRPDDKYELPEAFMYFHFISPLQRQSAKNDALCALYEHLVKFQVCEELYPALTAGLNYQFNTSEKGLVLKVSGYNEKLHMIVDSIAKGMITVQTAVDSYILDAFVKFQRKTYFNTLIKPRALNRDIRLSVLEHIRWPLIEKYKCLDDITLQDLVNFAVKFPQELYIQALIQGNYTEESAHNVMNSVLTRLNCKPIREQHFVEDRTVQLPQGVHFIRCHALNEHDTNTVITNFYQIGPSSVRIESIMDLLMMFVEEPLFDRLRTKEQLGYHVSATVRLNYGIAGYSIMVNSQETKTTAQYVEERIEVFRDKMLQILQHMSQSDYEHTRNSLIKLKMVADTALTAEVARNWDEIMNENYMFDRRRKQIDVLRVLNKHEIVAFLMDNEMGNLRKLSVQVIGHRPPGMVEPKPVPPPEDDEALANDANDDAMICQEDIDEEESGSNQDEAEDDDVTMKESSGDEELFAVLAKTLNVVFIPKEGDATTIVDIADFKENLDVYPTMKMDLDDTTRNTRIEDALSNT